MSVFWALLTSCYNLDIFRRYHRQVKTVLWEKRLSYFDETILRIIQIHCDFLVVYYTVGCIGSLHP